MGLSLDTVRSRLIDPTDKTSEQLLRYVIVGGFAYSIDISVLALLTEVAGIHYLGSAPIAFIFGLTTNYFLSTALVFNTHKLESSSVEFTVFAAIGVAGLAINELFLWLFGDLMSIHYLYAKVAATAFVFSWNFTARKYALFA